MDDAAWQEADIADHFMQNFPYDSSEAIAQTEVRMAYDDDFIYVIAKLKNNGLRKYVTPSLRRDFRLYAKYFLDHVHPVQQLDQQRKHQLPDSVALQACFRSIHCIYG